MPRLGYPAQNLSIPASTNHTLRLTSLRDPEKGTGAHAWSIDERDRESLLEVLDSGEADVMAGARGKEKALAPMGVPTE
ncbi:MAG: hypothetical protein H0V53_10780 [Rubrobacter sp.]|nr:hypothetical protein [Rubrobacter sp.]